MRVRCDTINEKELNHVGNGLVIRIILKKGVCILSLEMSNFEWTDGCDGVYKAIIANAMLVSVKNSKHACSSLCWFEICVLVTCLVPHITPLFLAPFSVVRTCCCFRCCSCCLLYLLLRCLLCLFLLCVMPVPVVIMLTAVVFCFLWVASF